MGPDTLSKPASRSYTSSSSFKTALFFTALLGVSASILAYFIVEFNQASLIREAELGFDSDIASVKDWQEFAPFMDLTEVIDRMERNHSRTYFSLQNEHGDYVYGDLNPDDIESSMLTEGLIIMDVEDRNLISENFHGTRQFVAKLYTLGDGVSLLVARDMDDALKSRDRMQLLGLLTILLMLVVICTSFFVSTFVVSRLNNISMTARAILETGDMSQRIDLDSKWDDLSYLSGILNELFERTESLMESVRQVSDNIAHDLRTPLTRLRSHMTDLDKFLQKSGDSENHKIAESLISETDQILRTFNALLRIARIESGKIEQQFSAVDLVEVLEDVIDLYLPLAEEKNIRINSKLEKHQTYGDRDMLFQVFANLLDNAIKFTPDGGKVLVEIHRDGARIEIRIQDSGLGVSDEDKKRIFQRFFRAEKSRTSPGDGLGLSLVSAVLSLHKGNVVVGDANPGAYFSIFLRSYP